MMDMRPVSLANAGFDFRAFVGRFLTVRFFCQRCRSFDVKTVAAIMDFNVYCSLY